MKRKPPNRIQSTHQGSRGFDKAYWEANYAQPETMEGIGNAKEHARYLKSFFELEAVDVEALADLGCGLGYLFREILYTFSPKKGLGLEPSPHAFKNLETLDLDPYDRIQLKLVQQDLRSWCEKPQRQWDAFDLGLCTSVFQYLPDEDLERIVPVLAERFNYLYLTVPTNRELDRQIDELGFVDPYALRRSRSFYRRLLRPHFTFISSRVLESKKKFDDANTLFTDLLFRF